MRIKTAALAVLLGVCAAASAQAQMRSRAFSPTYGFVYGEFSQFNLFGQTFDGGGLGAGWHFTRYLGVQGGAEFYRKAPVDMTNLHAELMLTYPANDKFSLYGSVGAARTHANANIGGFSLSGEGGGYRIGLGLEYWFARPWGLRAAYHRQHAGARQDQMTVGVALRF